MSKFSDFFVVPLSGTTAKVVRMEIKTREWAGKRDDVTVLTTELHSVSHIIQVVVIKLNILSIL